MHKTTIPDTFCFFIIVSCLGCFLTGCATDPYAKIILHTVTPKAQEMLQEYTQAISRIDDRGQVTCVFMVEENIRAESITRHVKQMLVLRTYWLDNDRSKANQQGGSNMNLDLLWEVDGQVALYRGAGFALVSEKNGDHDLQIKIRSASLALTSHTAGFTPVFHYANLTGKATTVNTPNAVGSRIEEFEKNRTMLEKIGLGN